MLFAAALAVSPGAASAQEMALVGQASYRVAFIPVYDAALFAPGGAFAWDAPFALTLTYRRQLTASAIAKRSVEEMAHVTGEPESTFAALEAELTACFADVAPDDRLTGYSHGADAASFFFNGEKSCDLSFPGFREAFFGIWLSADSRRPELTAELTGEG